MRNETLALAARLVPCCAGALLLAYAVFLAGDATAGELAPYPDPDAPAPGFELKALDGKLHRLEDYRGKVVLLNFWASWCPPCLVELPSMQRLAVRFAEEPFAVILINVGESPFKIAKFLQMLGVRLTALVDPERETFRAWGGSIFPTSYILDAEGRVRYTVVGPLEWDGDEAAAAVQNLLPRLQSGPTRREPSRMLAERSSSFTPCSSSCRGAKRSPLDKPPSARYPTRPNACPLD